VTSVTLYALSGMAVVAVCVYGLISRRVPGPDPDPVPHAMVLTGIVVAVCATAFALALARRVHEVTHSSYLPEEQEPPEESG
jgi:multicomponent Na+:H+ antiporter subunit C